MKTPLTIFVLFFSSSLIADDISDFEIEGMSVGDSLLEIVSKDHILEQFKLTSNYYKHLNNPNKFREVYIFNGKDFNNVKNIKIDCDRDTIIIKVNSKGPACHTGEDSCFFNNI